MIKQLLAIFFIYICTAASWGILGGTVLNRTYSSDSSNGERVGQLWGTAQNQNAPTFYYETKRQVKQTSVKDEKTVTEVVTETIRHIIPIDESGINANLNLEHRQKGLLWYSTYKVNFKGDYTISNPAPDQQRIFMEFPLPAQQGDLRQLPLVDGRSDGKEHPAQQQLPD